MGVSFSSPLYLLIVLLEGEFAVDLVILVGRFERALFAH